MVSQLNETLKNLCCNNGWSYGVFWRVNRRNSMLLTLEDAYFEDQIRILIDKMLQPTHMVGEGIIGRAAFTGKHRWMISDHYCGEWSPMGSVNDQEVFQDYSEFHQQFSSGMKTIAVISVAPQGVIQFGSTHKILERLDFVDHIRSLFQQLESEGQILPSRNARLASNSEIYDPSGIVASVISSGDSYSNYGKKPLNDGCGKDLMGRSQSSTVLHQSSPFTLGFQEGNMSSLMSNSSFHLKNQFQTAGAKAQVILSTPNPQFYSQDYTLSSLEQEMLSGMAMQESPNTFSANVHTPVSCRNKIQNSQKDATLTSLHGTNALIDTVSSTTLHEINKPTGLLDTVSTTGLSKSNPINNMSPWIAQSFEQGNNEFEVPSNENLTQTLGVASTSSGLVGDVFNGIPINQADTSVQNSITDTINLLGLGYDWKEDSFNLPTQQSVGDDLFDGLGLDFGQIQGGECWDDIISRPSLSTGTSECVSELDVGSMAGPSRGFLTEFGFEKLWDGIVGNGNSHTKPNLEDQLSTTTITRMGDASVYSSQAQFTGRSCIEGIMNDLLLESKPLKTTFHINQKEPSLKSRIGSWVNDSYSINNGSDVNKQTKKPEEPLKATKKRARPGESTRPRPKDRQQIQDRVKELREIVPNGAKSSIDALLHRTVKYLLFLQSVIKYADKLKRADEPKLIGDESGVVLKDNSSGGGATWAFEVGGQTMVFPIIVEDLNPPGQMLIELLCEDNGFFLEIADTIRGFGLTILKGVMKIRGDKIWGRFIVEANSDITRMDIFLSLIQLLQQMAKSGIGSSTHPSKDVVDGGVPQFMNYQQSPIQLPIELANQLH